MSIQNTNMNLEQLANKTRIQLYEERQKSLIIILTTNKYRTNTLSSDASVIEFLSILVTAEVNLTTFTSNYDIISHV